MPNLRRVVVTPTQQHMAIRTVLQIRDQLRMSRYHLDLFLPSHVENADRITLATHSQLVAIRMETAA